MIPADPKREVVRVFRPFEVSSDHLRLLAHIDVCASVGGEAPIVLAAQMLELAGRFEKKDATAAFVG
jgi:hypothetical protein